MRAKLDLIDHTCDVLASLVDVTAARLRSEPITAAAVERLLGRLVDLAVEINSHVVSARLGRAPGEYRASFDLAVEAGLLERELAERLKPSVGMRNVIIHEYVRLDLELVAASVPEAIDGYRTFVRDVARSLTTPG